MPSPFALSTFCSNLKITHRNTLPSIIPMVLLCFKTTSVLRLFSPCSGHGLFFVQELLLIAAARTYFCIKQFCWQFTLLKFSSCANYKILSTAVSSHVVTPGLSNTQQGSEMVHGIFRRHGHHRFCNFLKDAHLFYTHSKKYYFYLQNKKTST